MDEKILIITLTCLLVLGFLSLFVIIIPWFNWSRLPDWQAVATDNFLMGLIASAIGYGIYIGSKTM
jgi:hypothetical protein